MRIIGKMNGGGEKECKDFFLSLLYHNTLSPPSFNTDVHFVCIQHVDNAVMHANGSIIVRSGTEAQFAIITKICQYWSQV